MNTEMWSLGMKYSHHSMVTIVGPSRTTSSVPKDLLKAATGL